VRHENQKERSAAEKNTMVAVNFTAPNETVEKPPFLKIFQQHALIFLILSKVNARRIDGAIQALFLRADEVDSDILRPSDTSRHL